MTLRLVVSAINFNEGGALTVLRDCLASAAVVLGPEWEIVALVNDRRLLQIPGVSMLEFPRAKRSWLLRIYYEFWHFRKVSAQLRPDIWLSLHDISPWVKARRQVVYCHNPSPFYRISAREIWWEPKFLLFNLFYRYLYRINIHSNTYVVVQQEWLRDAFSRLFKLSNVVVAYPIQDVQSPRRLSGGEQSVKTFLYPALPRVFKNFEVVFEAGKILNARGVRGFDIRLTITGEENRYAAAMARRYEQVAGVSLIGHQSPENMAKEYQSCSAVIFPSRLETWGLPISEAKTYGKPLLVANLPYARDAVGTYDAVAFFDSEDPVRLADLIQGVVENRQVLGSAQRDEPVSPFAPNWPTLMKLLTAGMTSTAPGKRQNVCSSAGTSPIFSVIVPVYNIELHLRRCLDSLIGQTLEDLEIILVNDGSDDNSLLICRNYGRTYSNVQVQTQKNAGQGSARNNGLAVARGKYILFVDGDDWIEPVLCEDLYRLAEETGADFLNFGLDFVTESGRTKKIQADLPEKTIYGTSIFESAMLDHLVLPISWNKVYRREFLIANGIRFPEISANEDIYFSRVMAFHAKCTSFTPKVYYHALMRSNSTSRAMSARSFSTIIEVFALEKSFLQAKGVWEKYTDLYYAHIVKQLSYLLILASFRMTTLTEYLRCIRTLQDAGFYDFSHQANIISRLSLKNRLFIFICRFPRMLRFSTRLLRRFGFEPY